MTEATDDDFLGRIREAVHKNTPKDFKHIFAEHCTYTGQTESDDGILRDDRVFEGLVTLMREKQFVGMPKSSELMAVWEYEWGTLTAGQRDGLLHLLEEIVPRIADETSAFIASELLSQYYDYEDSLPILTGFAGSESEVARLYVPHAVMHLLERTQEAERRARLVEILEGMRDERAADVRREVDAAFRALPKLLEQGAKEDGREKRKS